MAFRSTITLSQKDQATLEQFKTELGIESSSQAIATAVKLAEFLRETIHDGKEIEIIDQKTGQKNKIEFVGLH